MKPINPLNPIVVLTTIIYLCLSVSGICQQDVDSLVYYRQVVDHPQDSEDLLRAYQFFEKHSKEAQHAGDLGIVAHDKFQLARVNYKFGFYNESEILTIEALEFLDVLPEDSFVLDTKKSIYNHLGMLYREKRYTEKALDLYDKALGYATNTFDSVTVFNNRSNTYKDFKEYQTAKNELIKAYNLLPRVTDTLTQALVLDNMGYLNFKLKDTSALTQLNRALELRLFVGNTVKTFSSYHSLSEYYEDKDKDKAMDYALKAYAISQALNNLHYQKDALWMLTTIDKERYLIPYKTLRDSLDDTQQMVQNRFATLKYDVSKSELQAEGEKAKRIRYQSIFFIFVVLSVLIVVLIRDKAKKQRLQHVYNTETRISKKVHDEVANDLYQVMTKIQTTTKSNDELLDDLEAIYTKTRDISKENTTIDVSQNFETILQDLLLGYKSPDINIMTRNSEKINWQKFSINKKHTIYRVLQELMTNMKKHSHATLVVISFNQNGSKIQITYKDNGKGCDLRKQTGLQNAENRIKAINGSITFDSQPHKGFQAILLV